MLHGACGGSLRVTSCKWHEKGSKKNVVADVVAVQAHAIHVVLLRHLLDDLGRPPRGPRGHAVDHQHLIFVARLGVGPIVVYPARSQHNHSTATAQSQLCCESQHSHRTVEIIDRHQIYFGVGVFGFC